MRYLITGHTGFKGSWLTLMLAQAGHEVHGISLEPLPTSLFELANIQAVLDTDLRLDIRNAAALGESVRLIRPDVVIHLAAQPLVRVSYRQPVETVTTNAVGTMNVLEATRAVDSIRAQLIVTTDKVYRNTGQRKGYSEPDALGGDDPYSSSKAMADLLTQSWVASFDCPPTVIARAGNVIGGGDVSPDRLLPDLLGGFTAGQKVQIRYPSAVRPWQHVLDCLNGYLVAVDECLRSGDGGVWNFGPDPEHSRTVAEVAELAASLWGHGAVWEALEGHSEPEAAFLTLDSSEARRALSWTDRLGFEDTVTWTVDWAKGQVAGESPRRLTERQIESFLRLE